jgi:Uma2 family endonuclease
MAAALPLSSGHGQPKRFSRAELLELEQVEGFAAQRWELLNGELFDKMGQNLPHEVAMMRVNRLLAWLYGVDRVRCQMRLETGEVDRDRNLPEPDLAVVKEAPEAYARRRPDGGDAVLVVEVSDSSLAQDLGFKAALYARAGVPEYWVLDLKNQILYVHVDPKAGLYGERRILTSDDTLPRGQGSVADLLPPPGEPDSTPSLY